MKTDPLSSTADRLSIEHLRFSPPPRVSERKVTHDPNLAMRAGMVAAVASFGLALARLAIDQRPAVGLVWLLVGCALSMALLMTRVYPTSRVPRMCLPVILWAGTFAMALYDGGLYSEALHWAVCVPLIAVLSIGRRPSLYFLGLVCVSAGALLGLHVKGIVAPPMNATFFQLALRVIGFAGAALCATAAGWYYELERHRGLAENVRERMRFQAVADASPDLIFSYKVDEKCFGYASSFALRRLGYSALNGRVDPQIAQTILGGIAQERLAPLLRRLFTRRGHARSFLHQITSVAGTKRWFRTSMRAVVSADGKREVLGVARDVTELQAAEAAAQANMRRLVSIVSNLRAGVAISDIQGKLVVVNKPLLAFFDIDAEPASVVGQSLHSVMPRVSVSAGDFNAFERRINEIMARGAVVAGEEVELVDGRVLERDFIPLRPEADGDTVGFLWSYQDITSRKHREREVLRRLDLDPVTGVASRHRFEQELRASCTDRLPFSLLFLDLDGFKLINDSLGHAAGDDALAVVGARLKDAVRSGDAVGRIGGDEFAVLLRNVKSYATAGAVCEKIHNAIRESMHIAEKDINVGISIGVALYPQSGDTPEELMRAADSAMYSAKRSGKNGWAAATPTLS